MFVNESQIRALIRLLGDEDERIVKTISGRLIDFGDSAVPLLQEAEIEQPEMADRIVTVLEEIRGTRLEEELRDLVAFPDEQVDLETGAFILARYAYPMLDVRGYQGQLDRMAQDVREQIGSRVSGEETVTGCTPNSQATPRMTNTCSDVMVVTKMNRLRITEVR